MVIEREIEVRIPDSDAVVKVQISTGGVGRNEAEAQAEVQRLWNLLLAGVSRVVIEG